MSTRLVEVPGEFPAFAPDHVVLQTPALWHPAAPREEAVILFRRSFILPRKQKKTALWMSASMRAELFLDGQRIARGPGRWDVDRWGVMRVPCGPLAAGKHVLAARVVHFGDHGGVGQLGGPGFFLLAVEDQKLHQLIGTGSAWRCHHDRSRGFARDHRWGQQAPYHVVGSGELVDAGNQVTDWLQPDSGGEWNACQVVCKQTGNAWGNRRLGHALRPDPLPPMAEIPQRFKRVADAPDDLLTNAQFWIQGEHALAIPPWRHVRLVLDQGELTNAWPVIVADGGRGAEIEAVAAEAPYRDGGRRKAPRDEVAGNAFYGFCDSFVTDGGHGRRFDTLWYRSFRYWVLSIRTQGSTLLLRDIHSRATVFPLRQRARFTAGRSRGTATVKRTKKNRTARAGVHSVNRSYRKLWEASWHTARLCAHETFMDCPHYEQAQFVGDSLVQARFHYLVANDDRLARRCLEDFATSRLPGGLTRSHYPARKVQVLPTFSLFWIGMLRDFLRYRGDLDQVRRHRDTGRDILGWFERRRRFDGLLGRVDAPFTDWTPAFKAGNAPQDEDGGSTIVTLLWACACRWQAEVEETLGDAAAARAWRARRREICGHVREACWDNSRRLLADTPALESYSLHAQVYAALAGCWPVKRTASILRGVLQDPEIIQPGTFYFCFHLAQALLANGLGEEALGLLPLWECVLEETGLGTFPESLGDARSDCHAWSVSPSLLFLEGTLGIRPADKAVGMDRIVFDPCLPENLESAKGAVPTPHGPVLVVLERAKGKVHAVLDSPVPVSVSWRKRDLRPGRHELKVGQPGTVGLEKLGSTAMTRRLLAKKKKKKKDD